VDLNDLTQLAGEWCRSDCGSGNDWCSRSDIDQSHSVTLTDFQELALTWLSCNDPEDTACTPNWL